MLPSSANAIGSNLSKEEKNKISNHKSLLINLSIRVPLKMPAESKIKIEKSIGSTQFSISSKATREGLSTFLVKTPHPLEITTSSVMSK